jgi:hypothetical protein
MEGPLGRGLQYFRLSHFFKEGWFKPEILKSLQFRADF